MQSFLFFLLFIQIIVVDLLQIAIKLSIKSNDMARFILDVMTEDITKVLDVIERDNFLSDNVSSIRCIDETNDNQFYSWDENFSPMMNVLSKKQLETDRYILSKY